MKRTTRIRAPGGGARPMRQTSTMPRGQDSLVSRSPQRPSIRKKKNGNGNGNANGSKPKTNPGLSKCARDYLCALEDPFNCIENACVPLLPSFPSRKLKVFCKGTLAVGTQGVGFIYGRPTPANNVSNIFHTTSTFAGLNLTNIGVGVSTIFNNSDYAAADFGTTTTTVQQRVVGFGIRVMYTGTELNRSGDVRVLEESDHFSLDNFNTSNFDQYDRSQKFITSREWTSVSFHPINPTETTYFAGSLLENNGSAFLGMIINSTIGNTFDWEAYGIFEIIGGAARGKTPSMSDTVGVDAVMNIVQSKPRDGYQSTVPLKKEMSMVESVIGDLSSIMKGALMVSELFI